MKIDLAIFSTLTSWITDFFRIFLFSFASLFLWICDFIYNIIIKIAKIDISSEIANWYVLIMTFAILFIFFRIAKIVLKALLDEDYQQKINFTNLFTRIGISAIAIGLIPIAFSYCFSLATDAVDNIDYFLPSTQSETYPSDIILESGRVTDLYSVISSDADLSTTSDTLNLESIMNDEFDINEDSDDDGTYDYFPGFPSLFLLIIESCCGGILMIMLAFQFGKRIFGIAFKYLTAPVAVSSLVDSESRTFATWLSLLLGDFIMIFFQLLCLYLGLYLLNNSSMISNVNGGIYMKIILFLAGLMAILEIPKFVTTIVGGNGASESTLTDFRNMTSTVSTMAAVGIGGTARAASVGLSAASGAVNGVKNAVGKGGEKISDADGFTGKAGAAAKTAASAVKGGVTGAAKSAGKNISNQVKDSSVGKTATKSFGHGKQDIKDAGLKNLKNVPKNAVNDTSSAAKGLAGKARNAAASTSAGQAVGNAAGKVRDSVDNFADNIASSSKGQAVSNAAGKGATAVKGAWQNLTREPGTERTSFNAGSNDKGKSSFNAGSNDKGK